MNSSCESDTDTAGPPAAGRLILLQLLVPGVRARIESEAGWAEFRAGYDPCGDPRLPPAARAGLSAGATSLRAACQ